MMSLWINLRKSFQCTGKNRTTRNLIKLKSELFSSSDSIKNLEKEKDGAETEEIASEKEGEGEEEEMLKFPYGSKECVVYKKRGNQ